MIEKPDPFYALAIILIGIVTLIHTLQIGYMEERIVAVETCAGDEE